VALAKVIELVASFTFFELGVILRQKVEAKLVFQGSGVFLFLMFACPMSKV
jgi:hypothetical protein